MSATTELTVVVATHNRADLLDTALGALSTQVWDGRWDIVAVDNASTDRTPEVMRRWAERMPVPMQIVRATDGRGPSYARNTGVAHSAAPHVAFVDDDDLVGTGWVAAIGEALRDHTLVASRFDYGHLNPPAVAATNDVNVEHLPEIGSTPVASSAGLGCHRTLWERLGGSDEALRYGEDIDFSLRASAAGTNPVLEPDAVYHVRLRDGVAAAFARGRHHGRASVDLYVRHGRAGGDRADPLKLLVRVWAGYVLRLPSLLSPSGRLVYAEQLGRRIGRLQGSAERRVWYP